MNRNKKMSISFTHSDNPCRAFPSVDSKRISFTFQKASIETRGENDVMLTLTPSDATSFSQLEEKVLSAFSEIAPTNHPNKSCVYTDKQGISRLYTSFTFKQTPDHEPVVTALIVDEHNKRISPNQVIAGSCAGTLEITSCYCNEVNRHLSVSVKISQLRYKATQHSLFKLELD